MTQILSLLNPTHVIKTYFIKAPLSLFFKLSFSIKILYVSYISYSIVTSWITITLLGEVCKMRKLIIMNISSFPA